MKRTPELSHYRQLDEQGWVRLEGFDRRPTRCDRLVERIEALFAAEGERRGREFKQEPGARRLANLVDKGAVFAECMLEPALLGATSAHVLGPALQAEQPERALGQPAQRGRPAAARGRGGAARRARLLGVQHALDARRLHGRERRRCAWCPARTAGARGPQDALADPAAPHPDEVLVTGRAGDVVVMNAHLWHGGIANRTAAPPPGAARVLLPLGQAAAAVPEGAAAPGGRRPRCRPAARAPRPRRSPERRAERDGGRSGFMK